MLASVQLSPFLVFLVWQVSGSRTDPPSREGEIYKKIDFPFRRAPSFTFTLFRCLNLTNHFRLMTLIAARDDESLRVVLLRSE